ncbi:MAG: SulP family inorganic anion transporter [Bacteroidota bacterium]
MNNLFKFDLSNLRGDILGGITAGVVALPLALAFGVSSGLGPDAGLYGAIFISFLGSLFGGTKTQISGPTAPMTAVSMVIIADIVGVFDGDVASALPLILSVFVMAALFQIAFGLIGIGSYIKYMPYPVVSGFMTAIGVIILITQILPAVGYYPKEDMDYVLKFKPQAEEILLDKILREEAGEGILVLDDFKQTIERADDISEDDILAESKDLAAKDASGVLGSVKTIPQAIKNISIVEFLLTLSTIIMIYGFKRIAKTIPSTLIALVIATSVAIAFNIDYRTIEQIPSGLPIPNFEIFTGFSISNMLPFVFSAFTLALLGSIDSLLTSIVADNMTRTRHKPNKELIGQGIGNAVSAIFGGIPGAGATIRTVVNINAGGKTRISGMASGVLLLIVLMALGPLASKIPAAVLAGILITVGIGVMDFKGLKALPGMPLPEAGVLVLVLVLSSVWNLVYAVGIGMVISSLMFMKNIGDMTANYSGIVSLRKEEEWDDEIDLPENLKDKTFIKHIKGPLFFGSASEFQQLARQIPDTSTAIIIRMENMSYLDQSGLFVLEDMLVDLCKSNRKILIVGLNNQPKYMLENIDIIPDLIPNTQLFDNFKDCLVWMKDNIDETNSDYCS